MSLDVDWVSAADIEKYGYCPLSWWLSLDYKNTDKIQEEGIKKHKKISKETQEIKKEGKIIKRYQKTTLYYALIAMFLSIVAITFFFTEAMFGRIILLLALAWSLIALYLLRRAVIYEKRWKADFEKVLLILSITVTFLSILGVTFILTPDETLGVAIETASIVWLMSTTFYFYLILIKENTYIKKRSEMALPDGEIIYIDDLEKQPLLKSERYKIRGRPDFILKTGEIYIPVEAKTGRVPRGPLFSHILQIAAYCMIIEDAYNIKPPYGLLKYGEVTHEIEYTEELKNILLRKMEEMHARSQTGNVHRNHNRPGKCLHCSRREICPERLDSEKS